MVDIFVDNQHWIYRLHSAWRIEIYVSVSGAAHYFLRCIFVRRTSDIYYILRTCGGKYANGRVQLGRIRNIGQYKFRNCNAYWQWCTRRFCKGNGNTRYYVYIRLFHNILTVFCTTHERKNIMSFGVNILLHTRMEKNCTFGFAGCVVFRIDYGANET